MTKIKRSGGRAQTCINPLEGKNKLVGRSLVKTPIEIEDTHAIIHFTFQ